MNNLITWSPGITLFEIEKQIILMAFRHYRGNKTVTANALGISIRTLDARLDEYELSGKQEKEADEQRRIEKERHLARARGLPQNWSNPDAGVRMEPASIAPTKHAVPLPQRQEVQNVLPTKAPVGRPRKSSG